MTHVPIVYKVVDAERFRLFGILVEIQFYAVLMKQDRLVLILRAY